VVGHQWPAFTIAATVNHSGPYISSWRQCIDRRGGTRASAECTRAATPALPPRQRNTAAAHTLVPWLAGRHQQEGGVLQGLEAGRISLLKKGDTACLQRRSTGSGIQPDTSFDHLEHHGSLGSVASDRRTPVHRHEHDPRAAPLHQGDGIASCRPPGVLPSHLCKQGRDVERCKGGIQCMRWQYTLHAGTASCGPSHPGAWHRA
jgi:hypothetical protein